MPTGGPSPMTPSSSAPSSPIRTRSIAPGRAGMPHAIEPPSKAGPAGQEAARMRSRLPTKSSVFVPTSM